MRETPLRRACLPPAGRYYPYANGSLRVRHSLLLTTRRRRRQYTEGKNRLCGVQLSHSYQRPGRWPPNRHNIPRSACRLRTAADRLRGRRSASPTGSRALAVEAAAGRLLRYPVAVHARGFPNCSRSSYNEIRFESTPISPRIVSMCGEGLRIGSQNVSINVDRYVRHR